MMHVSVFQVDVNTVYDRIQAMREALPVVWWKAVCYHYVRRTRQVTRYRNGDAFTTTQVYYERINSHTARSAFNFSHCGIKDISKNLVNLETYPATKIKFSKGFSFATVEAENEFEDQRAQFFHEHERRDDYMETREGLDLLNVNFKEYMIAFADPNNLPWYVSHIVFWIASILLLSWPLRVCIEYKTAYVHYHVHKLFGCNYLDPSYCPGTMSRVSTMGSSELEMNIRNNYTLVPSYSEALLMEHCYTQQQQTPQQSQDPNGNLTPSSIVNGFIPNAGGMTHYGTLPNGVAVAVSNGSVPNGNLHLANGHAGPLGNGHIPNGAAPNSLILPNGTAGLANGHIPNGGMPVILNLRTGELGEDDYLEYNSQRRRPPPGKDPLGACVSDSEEYLRDHEQPSQSSRRPRILSITTLGSTPESPEGHVNVVLEYESSPVMQSDRLGQINYSIVGENSEEQGPTSSHTGGGLSSRQSLVSQSFSIEGDLPLSATQPQQSTPVVKQQEEEGEGEGEGVSRSQVSKARRSLPTSLSLSTLPSESAAATMEGDYKPRRKRSSSAAPPPTSLPRPSSASAILSIRHQQSPQDPVRRCPAPPTSPESSLQSVTSTSSSQVSLSRHLASSSTRTSSVDLPLVHAASSPSSASAASSRRTSLAYRRRSGSFQTTSSSAGTSPVGTPPAAASGAGGVTGGGVTPTSQGSPRRAPSVQSCSSTTLSCHSSSSHTPSCQSNSSSSQVPSFHSNHSTSSYVPSCSSSPSTSNHAPSPHTSPRHVVRSCSSPCKVQSPHTSPRHVPKAQSPPCPGPSPHTSPHHAPSSIHSSPRHTPSSSSQSSLSHVFSPHCSPRHAPYGHTSSRRSSPHHTPSPHSSPRRVLSSQSSTSSIQSPSPHTSPRHAPYRHVPVNQTSAHSSPSPHASPSRRLIYQTTPPPEVPPPAYEEALTMRVVQESPVHRPSTVTTLTTVDLSDTELSETTRTTTRRYTLRCMETSL